MWFVLASVAKRISSSNECLLVRTQLAGFEDLRTKCWTDLWQGTAKCICGCTATSCPSYVSNATTTRSDSTSIWGWLGSSRAAFHRKGLGYANARRAWKVVVQGAHGQSRVCAVSPNCIRVDETPPANWIQEFGLGSITVGQYRHRILPDFFIESAEPYPSL